MRIIKVVHASTTVDTEAERNFFSIQNYDIENFLSRQELGIIEETHKEFKAFSTAENIKNITLALSGGLVFGGLSHLISENVRQEAFAKLAMRKTIADLLKDIISQVERVEIISLESARNEYPRTSNLSIGTYTLHPRDSLRLTRLEHYHKNLALEKDDELIVLLGRMGAKSLRIMEIDTEQQSGSIKMGVDTVSVDVRGDTNLSSKFEKNKDLLVTFEGNVVDIDSKLLENSLWFSDDSKLLSIFESRRFNPNKIEEYTLRNTYTETFDFDFNLAAKYLVVQADLKVEYQAISKKERFFHIEFGKSK